MDKKRRQKIQIRLSTMILLIAIAALVICMVTNRMNYESKVQQLNHELEIAKTQTEIGVRGERLAPGHPTMRALNEKLKRLQDKK